MSSYIENPQNEHEVELQRRQQAFIEHAARAAHSVNNAYRAGLGEEVKPDWDNCPEELKNSVRRGVRGIVYEDKTPEQSHEGWLRFKAEHGWTYGEVEDAVKKTHPCMLAYKDLPLAQRFKDTIFFCTVMGVYFKEHPGVVVFSPRIEQILGGATSDPTGRSENAHARQIWPEFIEVQPLPRPGAVDEYSVTKGDAAKGDAVVVCGPSSVPDTDKETP